MKPRRCTVEGHFAGETVKKRGGRMLEVFSPSDGEKIGEVPAFDVDEALGAPS
jgi:acyl-CoA reductase-like NAD-dependent aldehyde dehydrogenase